MTWVIALNGGGYVSMVSDIQVSWQDPATYEWQHADVVRKSFVLSPCLALGFAGSVLLGFRSLELAHDILRDDRLANRPDEFATALAMSLAKNVTPTDLMNYRGLALLVAGICPRGLDDETSFEQAFVAKLDHRNGFNVEQCRVMRVMGVGSGQQLYKEHFDRLNDRQFLWQGQEDAFPIPAIKFAYCTYQTLANRPASSVSRHMHFTFLSWQEYGPEVRQYSLDPPLWLKDAPDHVVELMKTHWHVKRTGGFASDVMPPTASSLSEIEMMLRPYAYTESCRMTLTTDFPQSCARPNVDTCR
jgi:hypothetical protein